MLAALLTLGLITGIAPQSGYLFTQPSPIEDTLWLAGVPTPISFMETSGTFTTATDKVATGFQLPASRFGALTWADHNELYGPLYSVTAGGRATMKTAAALTFSAGTAEFRAYDSLGPIALRAGYEVSGVGFTVVSSVVASGSLAAVTQADILAKLDGKNTAIYSSVVYSSVDPEVISATRSSSCWANGLLSANAIPVAVTNPYPGISGGWAQNQYVLIAPDIILGIGHFAYDGPWFFVADDNTIHKRESLGVRYYCGTESVPEGYSYSDTLTIRRLASPLPSSIRQMKLLGPSMLNHFGPAHAQTSPFISAFNNPYIFYFNQTNKAAVIKMFSNYGSNSNDAGQSDFWVARVLGDSGHAMGLVIGNELVFYSTTEGAAPWKQNGRGSYNFDAIVRGMVALGSSYTITPYDLSAFPTY